jgi:hypothetical protein
MIPIYLANITTTLDDNAYWLAGMEIVLQPGTYLFDFSGYMVASGLAEIPALEATFWCLYVTDAAGVVILDLSTCSYRQQIIGATAAADHITPMIVSTTSGLVTVSAVSRIRIHGARTTETGEIELPNCCLRAIKIS